MSSFTKFFSSVQNDDGYFFSIVRAARVSKETISFLVAYGGIFSEEEIFWNANKFYHFFKINCSCILKTSLAASTKRIRLLPP